VLHNLTIGHLDPADIAQDRRAVVRKPLDTAVVRRLLAELAERDPEGDWRLGVGRVEFREGYIVIPWLSHGTTSLSEKFALRL
jgi:hypothetical protein